MRLLTYNLRNGLIREERHSDAFNNWAHRRAAAIALIKAADPDVLALQEDCDEQLADIRARFGTTHDIYCDPAFYQADSSYNTILIRKSLPVVGSGAFWIAGDGTAQAKIDGSICYRHGTCVLLSSIPLLIVNVHLDHTDDGAVKQEEMRVFLALSERRAGALWPHGTIILGDFNTPPDTIAYSLMTASGRSDAARLQGCEQPTALNWPKTTFSERIDYIWLSGNLRDHLTAYAVLDGSYRRADATPGHASDHSAVLAELSLAANEAC